MEKLVQLLISLGKSISVCESFTGGLFVNSLTSIENASKVFKGAIITDGRSNKINDVIISPKIINEYGLNSIETVQKMAKNIQTIYKSEISIAINCDEQESIFKENGKPLLIVVYV